MEKRLLSLCSKTKISPTHVRSTEQRYNKVLNSAPFVYGKMWLFRKKPSGRSHSTHALQVEN